jgi:hypothetical protein
MGKHSDQESHLGPPHGVVHIVNKYQVLEQLATPVYFDRLLSF